MQIVFAQSGQCGRSQEVLSGALDLPGFFQTIDLCVCIGFGG